MTNPNLGLSDLNPHHVSVIVEPTDGRPKISTLPNEFTTLVPYAWSWMRFLLFWFLVLLSGGLLLVASVWFPELYTHLARMRLHITSLGRAHYVLIRVKDDEDGQQAHWVEVPVHRLSDRRQEEETKKKPKRSCRAALIAWWKGSDKKKIVVPKFMEAWTWFEFRHHRYVFDQELNEFKRYLASIDEPLSHVTARQDVGLTSKAVQAKADMFGLNDTEAARPTAFKLLFTKLVHPYYMLQEFTLAVWFVQQQWIRAGVILGLSMLSVLWSIYQELAIANERHRLVHRDDKIGAIRVRTNDDGEQTSEPEEVAARDLVPGDIVVLRVGHVPADLVLLSGACMVDIANIVGVVSHKWKVGGNNQEIDRLTWETAPDKLPKSFIPSGAMVTTMDTRCVAVVVSTGFSTQRGDVLRQAATFKAKVPPFERDLYRYLAVLSCFAIAVFIWRAVLWQSERSIDRIFLDNLDVVAIALPPALPLVLTMVINLTLARFSRHGVQCMDAQRFNSYGKISSICFDKTGTLTTDELTLCHVDVLNEGIVRKMKDIPDRFVVALACCHELQLDDGVLTGNAVDLAMFNATQGQLEMGTAEDDYVAAVTSPNGLAKYAILHRCPFDPRFRTSTVVVQVKHSNKRLVITKGAPDAIAALCRQAPTEFLERGEFLSSTHYTLGVAMRTMRDDDEMDASDPELVRASLERKLFDPLGFVCFADPVRPEVKQVLQSLYEENLDVRILTGDSPMAAYTVGTDAGMKFPKQETTIIDVVGSDCVFYPNLDVQLRLGHPLTREELHAGVISRVLDKYNVLLTGKALDHLDSECSEETMRQLVYRTKVFGRLRPQQKTWIIRKLKTMGLLVGMVGDGVNDVYALKSANVGFALSNAEAAGMAPFTSKAKDISDVPLLISFGRQAQMTVFVVFKFLGMFPIMQLAMTETLGYAGVGLSHNQFLWTELGIVLALALTMICTGVSADATTDKPAKNLFSPHNVASFSTQLVIFLAFFIGQYVLLIDQQSSWFCSSKEAIAWLNGDRTISSERCDVFQYYNTVDNPFSYENTCLWLFTNLQMLAVAMAFNVHDSFRARFYTNKLFTGVLLVLIGVNLWFLLDNTGTVNDTFQLMPIPSSYRLEILALFLGHFFAAILGELAVTFVVRRTRSTQAVIKT